MTLCSCLVSSVEAFIVIINFINMLRQTMIMVLFGHIKNCERCTIHFAFHHCWHIVLDSQSAKN